VSRYTQPSIDAEKKRDSVRGKGRIREKALRRTKNTPRKEKKVEPIRGGRGGPIALVTSRSGTILLAEGRAKKEKTAFPHLKKSQPNPSWPHERLKPPPRRQTHSLIREALGSIYGRKKRKEKKWSMFSMSAEEIPPNEVTGHGQGRKGWACAPGRP